MITKKYKIAITVGCFDLLHNGHLNLFKQMQERAEKVIVLLHSNRSIFENKGKFPVQNYDDRQNNLMDSGLVNSVIAVDGTDPTYQLNNVFDRLGTKDMIYVRGDDWLDFPGCAAVRKADVPIEFIPYTTDISSTKVREEIVGSPKYKIGQTVLVDYSQQDSSGAVSEMVINNSFRLDDGTWIYNGNIPENIIQGIL